MDLVRDIVRRSKQIMSKPIVVDSLKLTRDRQRVSGAILVAGLPRLTESLLGNSGTFDYTVAGDVDQLERPVLRLQVSGVVQLQCQRCLESLAQAVAIDTTLRLVAAEALDAEYEAVGDDPDEPDCIAASSELDVAALIEDEVLLALPSHPRHAEGVCVAKVAGANGGGSNENVTPFSVLAALKIK